MSLTNKHVATNQFLDKVVDNCRKFL